MFLNRITVFAIFFQLAYHLEILIFFFQRVGKKCAPGTNKCLQLSYKPRMVGLKTDRLAVMEHALQRDNNAVGDGPACFAHWPFWMGSLASHWPHQANVWEQVFTSGFVLILRKGRKKMKRNDGVSWHSEGSLHLWKIRHLTRSGSPGMLVK